MKNSLVLASVFGRKNFEYLLSKKGTVSKKEFGTALRVNFNAKTERTSIDLLLQCFQGLKKWHIMNISELWTFWKMPPQITIYRGAFMFEDKPRLSWSTSENIARMYGEGKMFKATISKKDILAYFENEKEVVALVEEGYEVYYI